MCIKIALCDDEFVFRQYLQETISQTAIEELLDFEGFDSGEELLAQINYGVHYDIIFLDVKMKKMSGNDVGKIIRQKDKAVILVYCSGTQLTVPPQLIRESIPFSYILKSVQKVELQEEIKAVLDAYKQQHNVDEQFIVLDCCDFGNKKVRMKDILYFTNESRLIRRKVQAKFTDRTVLYIEGSLKTIFEKVKDMGFGFAHNSFLVNCRHVDQISKKSCVILDNQEKVQLSRSKINTFTEQFIAVMEDRRA